MIRISPAGDRATSVTIASPVASSSSSNVNAALSPTCLRYVEHVPLSNGVSRRPHHKSFSNLIES
jgi:hypothetical protein